MIKRFLLIIFICVIGWNLLSQGHTLEEINYEFKEIDQRFNLNGFNNFEDWGCWTEGEEAEISFDHPNLLLKTKVSDHTKWVINFEAVAFLPSKESSVSTEVVINGLSMKTLYFNVQKNKYSPVFSLDNFSQAERIHLVFKIKGASSPFSHEISPDKRILGLGCRKLRIVKAQALTINPEIISAYFTQSKDFRHSEPPSDFLFQPVKYEINSNLCNPEALPFDFKWLGVKEKSLNGAEIFAKKNVLVFANDLGTLITDHSFQEVLLSRNGTLKNIILNKNQFLMPYIQGKTCIFRLEGIFRRHYYDFMLHFLPAIHFLSQKYPDIKFLYHQQLKPFEKEAFKAIAFEVEKHIIPFPKVAPAGTLALSLEELIIPTFGNVSWRPKMPNRREFYPEIIQFLKHKFIPKTSNNEKKRRIYISRDDLLFNRGISTSRSVINEEEIQFLLVKHNFEIVTLTEKTIEEQAEIFNEAEVIIGAHGAGFTNLVFCKKGTQVLEFIPPDWQAMAYYHICALAQLEHSSLIGEAWTGSFNSSFYVDSKAIISFLQDNGFYVEQT